MGACATQFYSSDTTKQTLARRIAPTDEQIASQREYWNDLAEYLKSDLRSRSGCTVTSWIQGSYKFATQIRPARKGLEYDIDLGVYFAWKGSPNEGSHSAADLKAMVQDSLTFYAEDAETDASGVTDPKEFCSRIRFSEDFHIDVPAYHEWDDVRHLASKSDGFVNRDPYTIWEWWIEAFEEQERARARRMVRYIKMWAALKFDEKTENTPSSILLTVLIAYAYSSIDLASKSGDDEVFGALIAQMVADLEASNSGSVSNPVDPDENLNRMDDDFASFEERLAALSGICERALQADDAASAAAIWSEAFGHFFPLPAEEELVEATGSLSKSLVTAFVPDVSIEVTLPTGKSYMLRNAAPNIPKGSTLKFLLANYANAPSGSLVSWVVRNEGEAAEAKNDLGHFSGYGETPAVETAEYRGKHFMDVTVVANGRVVGLRRVPVSVISNSVIRAATKRLFRAKR